MDLTNPTEHGPNAIQLAPLALGSYELGEGIGWVEGELWHVDILAGAVHRTANPLAATPETSTECFPGEVGFAIPRVGGGMVVGAERTLWLVDPDGVRTTLLQLDEAPQNRFNDAICDARGRLWAGTFARDRRRGAANLYRIDPDGAIECVLSGLTISNGLDWLDGGARLHFVDSPEQRIDAFDVDVDAGHLCGRRPLVCVDERQGAPDGLCVDADGGTWVALFGGAAIHRYAHDGTLDQRCTLTVPHVTDVCLAGNRLFATTTRHRLSSAERAALPDAGRIFHGVIAQSGTELLPFAG